MQAPYLPDPLVPLAPDALLPIALHPCSCHCLLRLKLEGYEALGAVQQLLHGLSHLLLLGNLLGACRISSISRISKRELDTMS